MADDRADETQTCVSAGVGPRTHRDGFSVQTIIGRNSVHQRGIIPKQGKLKRTADEKRARVDDGKEDDAVVGNEGFAPDDTELQPGMIIDERSFSDIRKSDNGISADLGAFLDHTPLDDGRRVHFGFGMNLRHRTEHLELIERTGFGQRHELLPQTHLLQFGQSRHIRGDVGQRQM